MAQRIKVCQHDHGIKFVFVIKKDGMPESLQNANIIFKLKHTTEGVNIVHTCKVTDSTAGECEYTLTSQDTAIIGGYISELETRFANGTILSCDNPVILTITPEQIPYESGGRKLRTQ